MCGKMLTKKKNKNKGAVTTTEVNCNCNCLNNALVVYLVKGIFHLELFFLLSSVASLLWQVVVFFFWQLLNDKYW